MLGSVIKSPRWCWTAIGKHPTAMDYLHLGESSALMDALAEWVTKGYDELLRDPQRPPGIYSWRFWLRGVRKGGLICGLLRDSSDRIGRPFPLLIMGEGALKGWEKLWRLLPVQLNRTWKDLEYIAAHRFDDAQAMEEQILGLHLPVSITPDSGELNSGGGPMLDEKASSCRQQLLAGGFGIISLNTAGSDSDQTVAQSHEQLVRCCKDIPRAVFIGGTPQRTCLAVVEHPLGTADFIRLWTAG